MGLICEGEVRSLLIAPCEHRMHPYLEVKRNEREYERLEILHKVIEHTQSFRICRLCHVY